MVENLAEKRWIGKPGDPNACMLVGSKPHLRI
jgi:hypothetical protein